MVVIREVPSPEGMKDVFPVAKSAWGMEEAESFIADMLNALKFHGGLVLGAYDGGRMVGFQYAFIGRRGKLFYLYSHMTGVVEEKKYSGIGYELKMAQKRWARENGFKLVAWTFDPLMGLNANFNVRKLGVIARTYLPNFYGLMTDKLNRGAETDRFVAEWWVESKSERESFDPASFAAVNSTAPLEGSMRKLTGINKITGNELVVEIPYSFTELKSAHPEAAVEWRVRSREIFTSLFSSGYAAVSFTSSGKRSYYLLRKGPVGHGVPATSPFSGGL